MEGVAEQEKDHDHEDEHDNSDHEHGIALEHLPNPLLPGVIPVNTPSHRIDAARADELRPGGFQLLPHPERAPLQRVRGCKPPPEVDEEGGPEAHAYTHDNRCGIVGRPHDDVDEPQEHASSGRNCEPLVEVRHEEEVQRDALSEVIPDLVYVSTPSKGLEPVLVQVHQLSVLVQGEVMQELGIVDQLPDVYTSTVVVLLPDYVINEPDPVRRPKNGTRLRVRAAPVVVCPVEVVLVDVRDDAPVAVVEVPPTGVVVLVWCEGGEVLRLELQLVLPHLRDLPQVLLVGSNPDEDLVTVT
mmetsp:Transcript_41093/g.128068  ORF Transcript_41093/g.128068 Transcript_41093/m.128068 type:complete len:299 (-) Transcript_41093:405-1301(-)